MPGVPAGHGPRQDIQALRALAVLLVLAHHFSLPFVQAGFLGVDIFFVVSGYLMGSIILRSMAEDQGFSVPDFYARRLRRLAPAAVATAIATLIAGAFLLDPFERRDLWFQALGVLTLSSNVVLWTQTDYFGSGSSLKPLLHYWSLAVEEQFYLLLPFFLTLLVPRARLAVTAAAIVASWLACAVLVSRSPSATFYFLPTRAWEPGLGVLLAMWLARRHPDASDMQSRTDFMVRAAKALAWISLVIIPVIASEAGHPGQPALAVCLATLVILIPVSTALPRPLFFLQTIGDRSFSLYLVHWPLLALLANLYVGRPPAGANLLAALATLVFAEIQYRFVETPFRDRAIPLRKVLFFPVLLALALAGFATRDLLGNQDPGASRQANMGLGYNCTSQEHFAPRSECKSKANPAILVWGDSLAMHLVPGLVASGDKGIVQATRWVCGPITDVAPVNHAYSAAWASSCLAWNGSVIESLDDMPSIKVVVLSSILSPYVEGGEPGWSLLRADGDNREIVPRDNRILLQALTRTVLAVQAKGRRVVLVTPVPSGSYDIGRCLVRRSAGLPNFGTNRDCTLLQAQSSKHNAAVRAFLQEVERRRIVPIIDLDQAMCQQGNCMTRQGSTSLYRDSVHLSRAGSQWLARRMNLERAIWMTAR